MYSINYKLCRVYGTIQIYVLSNGETTYETKEYCQSDVVTYFAYLAFYILKLYVIVFTMIMFIDPVAARSWSDEWKEYRYHWMIQYHSVSTVVREWGSYWKEEIHAQALNECREHEFYEFYLLVLVVSSDVARIIQRDEGGSRINLTTIFFSFC